MVLFIKGNLNELQFSAPLHQTIPVDSIFTAGPLFNRCPSAAPATTSFRARNGPNDDRHVFSTVSFGILKEFVFFSSPEELESCDGRIHYELLKGEGPAVGWVSQKLRNKEPQGLEKRREGELEKVAHPQPSVWLTKNTLCGSVYVSV